MTDDLLALCDWLAVQQVTHVAMESTGVLWKPIWNILEGYPPRSVRFPYIFVPKTWYSPSSVLP